MTQEDSLYFATYMFLLNSKELYKSLQESKNGIIFASLEPAKPLNDAQMCGSFFYTS